MRMYCEIESCEREYQLKAEAGEIFANNGFNIEIHYKGDCIHTNLIEKALPNKNERQKESQEELKTMSAADFRSTKLPRNDIIENRLANGSATFFPTKDNARKMKSKAMQQQDLDKDDILDLIEMQKNEGAEGLIQTVCLSPFYVLLMDPYMQQVLSALKESQGRTTGFLDATGRIARRPNKTSNAVLLHSLLTYLPSLDNSEGNYYFLGGLLTSQQTQTVIGQMLNWISMKSFKKLPLLDDIVTDNSWANINAISVSMNAKSISDYLEVCYHVWYDDAVFGKLTLIHLCMIHLLKQYKKEVSHFGFAAEVQHNLIRIFCLLSLCRDVGIYETVVKNLFVLLVAPSESNEQFKEALKTLNTFCNLKDWLLFQDTQTNEKLKKQLESNDELIEYEIEEETDVVYKQSPFYRQAKVWCKQQAEKFESEDTELQTNPYFNPELAEILCKKYFAFAPLFININHPIEVSQSTILLQNKFYSFT